MMMNRISSKNRLTCYLCNSKSGIRRVTLPQHKKCFYTLSKVVPIAAGNLYLASWN